MKLGKEFLRELSYHGVAHLDFRRDVRDGQPKLLDFNARLAGTNEISLRSGIDFGYLLYKLALPEDVDPVFEYEADREFRWLLPGELRHLSQTHHKLKTLCDLMKWKKVSSEISITDPLPHFMIVIAAIRRRIELIKCVLVRFLSLFSNKRKTTI